MEKKNTDREYLTRLEKLKEQSPQEQKELLEKGEISRLQYEVNRRININIPKDKSIQALKKRTLLWVRFFCI